MCSGKLFVFTTSFLCILLLSKSLIGAEDQIARAEKVAVDYIEAYYQMDAERIAALTHPDKIARTYDAFNDAYDQAEAVGLGKQFLDGLQIDSSPDQLGSVSIYDVYVAIWRSYNANSIVDLSEIADSKIFTVVGRELIDEENIEVVVMDKSSDIHYDDSIETTVRLKSSEGEWFVLSW